MRPVHAYMAEGIVLKRRAIGEADRILTVFTKQYGKVRLIAKGVRRITSRRAGHLEVFSHVILSIHAHKGLDILMEAQAKDNLMFEGDITRIGFAYCMCELVDQLLADRQEHEDIFFLLRDGLQAIRESQDPKAWQLSLSHFVHKLLWHLGFLPASRRLRESEIQPYVEEITERRLRAWPLLTQLGRAS